MDHALNLHLCITPTTQDQVRDTRLRGETTEERQFRQISSDQTKVTTICQHINLSMLGVEQRSLIHSPLRKFRSINMQCTRRTAGASERTEEDPPTESCGVFPCRTRGTSILEAKAAAEVTTTCLHTSPSSHGEGRHRLIHSLFPKCRRMTMRFETGGELATWDHHGSGSMKTTRKRSGSRFHPTEVTSPTTTCPPTSRSTHGEELLSLIHFQFPKSLLTIMVFTEDGAKDLLEDHIGALI